MAAERMGKEAAIFVASGTMGNLVSLLTHTTGRGDEVIAGHMAHILQSEVGGGAGSPPSRYAPRTTTSADGSTSTKYGR